MAAGDKTQGTRVDEYSETIGDYWRHGDGHVFIVLPTGQLGGVDPAKWTVTEHADGTITVDPSILMHETKLKDGTVIPGWHGYLRNGVLEEV